ncbi:hypothetical protein ABC855_g4258 [[Candida] zeylanoides]
MGFTIKVENVPECDEAQLRAIFESFGMIDVITLKTASAMVTYEEEDDSVAAIANMNGFEFFGKCLKVSKAGN